MVNSYKIFIFQTLGTSDFNISAELLVILMTLDVVKYVGCVSIRINRNKCNKKGSTPSQKTQWQRPVIIKRLGKFNTTYKRMLCYLKCSLVCSIVINFNYFSLYSLEVQ